MAKKLLLAEDSLTIQKVFALTFQQSDISLTTVDNGEDAVRLAKEISPDLVVADVTLPDKDGFEVAMALRDGEATRTCPILILAGSLPPFDEEKFRRCGADAVLFKPFESQELIDKVDALFRGGEVPAEAAEGTEAGTGEGWDFSDVLEEVEEEAGKPAAPVRADAALLPEDEGSALRGEEAASLGEFDVSLEEIAREVEGAVPPGGAPEGGEPAIPETAVEGLIDLQAEELGFAEMSIGGEVPLSAEEAREEAGDAEGKAAEDLMVAPPAEPAPSVETPLERMPEDVLEPGPFAPPDPDVAELTAAPEMAAVPEDRGVEETRPPEEEAAPGEARLREGFSDRAREIVEKVAAETVEKVMWEMMERLSGEIRQQIREAVEAVAWDVIPATAESLIREEIERIRGKAGE